MAVIETTFMYYISLVLCMFIENRLHFVILQYCTDVNQINSNIKIMIQALELYLA